MTQPRLRLRRLSSREPGFEERLAGLLCDDAVLDAELERRVRAIVDDVRERGDEALLEYTRRFDASSADSLDELEVPAAQRERAHAALGAEERDALEHAAGRIRAYHQRQLGESQGDRSWSYEESDGTVLGQVVRPIERVGVYVPGGKAAYPSSVLMAAIPARVAGVREVLMCAPAGGGRVNPLVLAAAHLAGVDRVWSVGGAQAVAALAYGTESIAAVDKIVGPGNAYVAMAKRIVFGEVGIDMLAGPSEIVIVADGSTPAEWVAMDLFSQAEHDESARALLLSPRAEYLDEVQAAAERLLPGMERRAIIERSLLDKGALIETPDLAAAIALVNRIAPEHLELSLADARAWLPQVHNAGAIFLGAYSSEVLGDYCAGPNHVLPTSRTARFSSPLGVYDFQKRSSVIDCSREGARTLARVAGVLARGEGLTAHARAAALRLGEERS